MIREKLARAFNNLRKEGLIAMMDFMCCQTCGWAAINEIANKQPSTIGAVFFHQQDSENLDKYGRVYLAYGSFQNDDDETVKIGEMICDSLTKEGLGYEWNRDPSERILVFERKE